MEDIHPTAAQDLQSTGFNLRKDTAMEIEHRMMDLPIVPLLDILRKAIFEVIAFPTLDNFSRLLKHSKSAYDAYFHLGRHMEMGKGSAIRSEGCTTSHDSIDADSRSKLNTFGVTLWNMILKHSNIFIDAGSVHHDSDHPKEEEQELSILRTIASGYIRSLAARLVLIDKLLTKCDVPCLVPSNATSTSDTEHRLPLALVTELEFGLAVLSRAGRALFSGSTTTTDKLDAGYDYIRASYDTLLLALVCWKGLCDIQKRHHDSHSSSDSFLGDQSRAHVLDVMLLLPDVASQCTTNTNSASDHYMIPLRSESRMKKEFHMVVRYLIMFEEFVSDQLATGDKNHWDSVLFSYQKFLPSLAKISYKHGNRFARQKDYESSKEVLNIAIRSTDLILSQIKTAMTHISQVDKSTLSTANAISRASLEVNESEMLVISKQCFYVMSSVLHSQEKFDDAQKCLDRIESYLDEMSNRVEQIYSQTIKELSSDRVDKAVSAFALEAPRMQDATQIRTRAESARDNAKSVEAKERIFLNYHRVMYTLKEQEIYHMTSSTDLEMRIDQYFQNMLDWMKKLPFDPSSTMINPNSSSENPFQQHSLSLILSVARAVTLKRLLIIDNERVPCADPFTAFVKSVPEGSTMQLELCLESMDTCTMAAINANNNYVKATPNSDDLSKALNHRVLVMGQDFVTRLQKFMSRAQCHQVENGLTTTSACNLSFSTRNNYIEPLLVRARDYCAKALSHYQSRGDAHESTIDWCEILLKVHELWRTYRSPEVVSAISEADCDKIVAGVMAIKAMAQSSTGDHGSGLKTAREAWSKDGTQVCTLVALFVCSFKYESSSVANFDDRSVHSLSYFQNTILEIDNAFRTYRSLTKVEKGDEVSDAEKIFDAFHTMSHMSSDHLVLSAEMQHRWLYFAIENAHIRISDFGAKSRTGNTSIFCILQHYMSCLEKILKRSFESIDSSLLILNKLDDFKTILDMTLRLIINIRDMDKKKTKSESDMALVDDFSLLVTEESKETDSGSISVFAPTNRRYVIGSDTECLQIAEYLWNLGNILLASHSLGDHHMKQGVLSAYFFRCAHDFAFLSEEELGENLTAGYLAFEGFRQGPNDVNYLDISLSPKNKKSCDLCSQFSFQALFLSAVCIVETLNKESSKSSADIDSIENSHGILISIQCLNAALSECQTLESDGQSTMTNAHKDAIPWLFLNLLILQKDDQACSVALENGGILEYFHKEFYSLLPDENMMQDPSETHDIKELDSFFHRVIQFATHAEVSRMSSSAKSLYSFCIYMLNKREEMMDVTSMSSFVLRPTLGTLYRKLIGMSHSVDEILRVFETIGQRMNCSHTDTSRKEKAFDVVAPSNYSADSNCNAFSTQDLDFFVIDAHNRSVTLLGIGDVKSAEKLMVVCMNLLQRCSKEVECYGSDIRRTYRHVLAKLGAGIY